MQKNMKPNKKTAEHCQPNPPEKPDSMAGIRPCHTQTYRVEDVKRSSGERSSGRAVGLPAASLGGLLCDLSDPTG